MITLRRVKEAFGKRATFVVGLGLFFIASQALAEDECGFAGGDWKAGKTVYLQTCVACHGKNGRGTVPGAPDFTKAGGRLSNPHHVITDRIEHGFQDPASPMAMPAKGANPTLNDQDIKNVHAYLHHTFGCGGKKSTAADK